MVLNEWLNRILIFISGSGLTFLGIIYILITSPEKIEKWGSIILKFFAYRSKRAEKMHMAMNIQYSIDEKRKKLGVEGTVLSYGVEIKWTEENVAEIDLQQNKVIVMMRPFQSQARNYANVVSLYVPSALLPESRRYIDRNVVSGLDFIISKTLLDSNPSALNYYIEQEIQTHSEEVTSKIKLLEPIHERGYLSRVIIPELKSLSSLHPMEPTDEIKNDTLSFVDQMHAFNTAPSGTEDERYSGIYNGEFVKMTMVPVGRQFTLLTRGIQPHLDFINQQIAEGVTHFYIVSASDIGYARRLSTECCVKLSLTKIYEEEYQGVFRGSKRKIYCSLCIKE